MGRLLSPEVEESAGLATGDLLVALFRKAGEAVGPMMKPLLEEMIKRLSTAKTATGTQVCFHCTQLSAADLFPSP